MFGRPETDILAHTVCGRMCSNGPLGNRTHSTTILDGLVWKPVV